VQPSLDILCVSDMTADLVLLGRELPRFGQVETLLDDYLLEIGGSANIFASQFCKLGGRAGLVGCVGADVLGSFLKAKLTTIGVDLRHVRDNPRVKTGISTHLVHQGDRAILTYLGTADALRPEDLGDELLAGTRHWHIASYFLLKQLRSRWPSFLREARRSKKTVSLDTNWDPDERWTGVEELLPLVDIFLPNENEAVAITRLESADEAGQALSLLGPLVVIKCGARGAVAFRNGQEVAAVEPESLLLEPVDSTGAGDNFDAGFLRGYLLDRSIEDCLRLGSRCAAASLGALGGIEGQWRHNVADDGKAA
jgi:sugar/nucleoside kinase (ribokinase family)